MLANLCRKLGSGDTPVPERSAKRRSAGRRQFRVLFADAPGGTNWADLRVCASTGAVTEVCETNAAPRRFYRVVSP